MGTATVTVVKQTVEGRNRVTYGTIAGSASYATGGETIGIPSLGLGAVESLTILPGTATKEMRWDGSKTAPKVLIAVADVQVAATSNQTTATGEFRAVGSG